ncbi:hypothetical protein [Anaerosporobacter faecicola]|uniref:hypothetical protein n=1 Tax=Anaerosporobacter faecicola TaxID=2718714 RepID=UPI001439D7A6|nr:hypothetical protein [Anaerosporobacter faecicola]
MEYQVSSYNKESKCICEIQNINEKAWPKFMQGEKVMRSYWGFMLGNYSDCQKVLTHNNKIVAVVNAAPFRLGDDVNALHEDGMYWGLKQVTHNYYSGEKLDTLLALQVVVNPEFRGNAISYECVEILKMIAREQGVDKVVIPLRPSLKHLYPLIDSREYISWKNDDGLPYDPWLRVHVKAGGDIVKQCRGISIWAPIEQWKEWSGLYFGSTGEYIVPGALNPVHVDIDKNLGTYTQDNIWVVHRV